MSLVGLTTGVEWHGIWEAVAGEFQLFVRIVGYDERLFLEEDFSGNFRSRIID